MVQDQESSAGKTPGGNYPDRGYAVDSYFFFLRLLFVVEDVSWPEGVGAKYFHQLALWA
jgi:hypothetical protein